MFQKIVVIGIGLMGGNLAVALHKAGCNVVGFDVDAVAVSRLQAQGLAATSDIEDALNAADILISSLPNPEIVRKALLQGGALDHAEKGAILIEMSSIDPDTMRAVDRAFSARGLGVLDVPVSGGPVEALSGNLVLLVGGDPEVMARAQPVLDIMGGSQHHTGEVGTAKVVKLVNNVMTMGNVMVAAEAFAMGTAAGVDPERLYGVLSQSGGRSHHFTKRFPKAIQKNFDPGFRVQLGEKDVALAVDVGRTIGQAMPVASLIREMYQIAMSMGYRDNDIVAVLDMFQNMNAKNAADSGSGENG